MFFFVRLFPFFKSGFTGSDPAPHSTPASQNSSIPTSASASTFSFPISSSSSSVSTTPQKGWSKQNLKKGERSAWTRGRDGWSPVVGSNSTDEGGSSTGGKDSGKVEGNGEIRFVPCLFIILLILEMIEIQQQSHILVSSWVGVCRDGGLEEGFRM